MNWIDLLLMLTVAASAAVGVQRKLVALIVGIGAVLLFRPLLILAETRQEVALALAIFAGLLLGLLGRWLTPHVRVTAPVDGVLGGLGGFLLGATLALALVTSFPLGRDINDRIVYPAPNLPPALRSAVPQSRMVHLGRDILLYPLLEAHDRVEPRQRAMLRGLHRLFVVGRPWERGPG